MAEYTWAFDRSFLVFLLIAFVSMTTASRIRSLIPMPLIYGVLFILGFAFHILPTDMLLSANMIAVGTIAYNVLVVHSGTMINLKLLREKKQETFICILSMIVLISADVLILTPVLGRGIALLAPGSVVGGGASCAIASRLVLAEHPELSVFPWLIFMLQGLFSVPVVTWALKKESLALVKEFRARGAGSESGQGGVPPCSSRQPLCARIPTKYKTTPYYLGMIMIVTVVNNLLHQTVLSGMNINPNITALCFGFLLGGLGLMDRAPLFKSDSYGLLILGLMGLMANTLANCPWQAIVGYIPALLLVFVVSTAVLVLCGIAGAKICGFRPYRGIALTMNCVMGFPVNDMLLTNAAKTGETDAEQGYLKGQLSPVLGIGTMLISNALSTIVVSIMAMFV